MLGTHRVSFALLPESVGRKQQKQASQRPEGDVSAVSWAMCDDLTECSYYTCLIVLLNFYVAREKYFSFTEIPFFFFVQMQTIPLPEPLFVEFLWILLQPPTVKRVGLRP